MKGPRDDRRVEAAPRESHTLIAGRYEVLEELGDGPAGTTYKVRHALLGNLLSVTVLPAALTDDPPQLALVQDAVRRAFGLRHDHIVPVLDFGEEAKRHHLVEAFDDAEPLDRVLREGRPLAPADALQVARQLADALAYAHERGVVHGALAPGTVRIRREAPPRAMLSGFATAALAARVPYSAPERLTGGGVDPRGDIFALGLLVFEMLEGKRFFGGSDDEVRDILLHGKAPLLPQFSCIVPSGVSGLVGRALRRSPAHRQQSMAQVRSEIDACLRRLGERGAEAKAPVSGRTPVRRLPVIVVDEALAEPANEVPAAPTSDRSATRSRRRVGPGYSRRGGPPAGCRRARDAGRREGRAGASRGGTDREPLAARAQRDPGHGGRGPRFRRARRGREPRRRARLRLVRGWTKSRSARALALRRAACRDGDHAHGGGPGVRRGRPEGASRIVDGRRHAAHAGGRRARLARSPRVGVGTQGPLDAPPLRDRRRREGGRGHPQAAAPGEGPPCRDRGRDDPDQGAVRGRRLRAGGVRRAGEARLLRARIVRAREAGERLRRPARALASRAGARARSLGSATRPALSSEGAALAL